MLPLARTATCFGLNRPSTQRSKTISQCNTYLLNIYSVQCVGSQQCTVYGHSAAGSYRTVLYGLMRCVLVQLQCWGSVIKLLGDICETAVQLSVHTLYRYGGYCCMCHGENREIGSLIILEYLATYI